jgi:hypothetical protein
MWQALISPLTNLIGQVIKNRAEEKNAIHNAKMEVIKNTASWEQLMASASATSWKDEWFTLLLSHCLWRTEYAPRLVSVPVVHGCVCIVWHPWC